MSRGVADVTMVQAIRAAVLKNPNIGAPGVEKLAADFRSALDPVTRSGKVRRPAMAAVADGKHRAPTVLGTEGFDRHAVNAVVVVVSSKVAVAAPKASKNSGSGSTKLVRLDLHPGGFGEWVVRIWTEVESKRGCGKARSVEGGAPAIARRNRKPSATVAWLAGT